MDFSPAIRICAATLAALSWSTAVAQGDPRRGELAFRQCLACHSLEPGHHLTGPSLANVVNRGAATAQGFTRYSDALIAADLVWTPDTLDRWLSSPSDVVPGTSMRVAPIDDPQVRQDLIAYLESAGDPATGAAPPTRPRLPSLKALQAARRVKAIEYCADAYRVLTDSGDTHVFWEFNLRFKSDSSAAGPPPGKPAIVPQGMRGDRAQVVFSDPAEISVFIQQKCRR